ncbi:MAG: 6-carboxytetrahydropterin synthase QueD [Chloroflexi bacterium]|jgi:6-pyruvoyltetrahydropterin/6-carboxytetrahydropterin synthase|nr:6-carboxytetrahydropterin synthase QueD [Chloroflexota bacterium]MBT7081481.1 6-carboxytetrahydropterin synthase QueD [Chloroflexota bacterium]MBT7289762.1 6-carboxytetrahydropterin synthase QueD [Chloroflexota bacterium]
MFEVSVKQHFDAAHYLRDYNGKCEVLHGHRFEVVVNLKCEVLNDIGLAYDFTELKKHLNDILDNYDHTCINEVAPFDKLNASSENMAVSIYEQLKQKLGEFATTLSSVQVWESPTSCVTYSP